MTTPEEIIAETLLDADVDIYGYWRADGVTQIVAALRAAGMLTEMGDAEASASNPLLIEIREGPTGPIVYSGPVGSPLPSLKPGWAYTYSVFSSTPIHAGWSTPTTFMVPSEDKAAHEHAVERSDTVYDFCGCGWLRYKGGPGIYVAPHKPGAPSDWMAPRHGSVDEAERAGSAVQHQA